MRVLMLGWEFPPSINGGLGTACAGLVRALNDMGTDIVFVVPEAESPAASSHTLSAFANGAILPAEDRSHARDFEHVTFRTVAVQLKPYESNSSTHRPAWQPHELLRSKPPDNVTPARPETPADDSGLFADVRRYTAKVEALAASESFDVIHAHDWMTFPAALSVAGRAGKPLVVHIHSTESDRGGPYGDSRITDIERRGLHGALRVVAVSQLTKNTLIRQYGVPADRIEVIYNAVEPPPGTRLAADEFAIRKDEKIVLFMGRLTMQKGPEYFLTAARKVLEVVDDVKFVMAGSGDLARQTVELAASFGIAHKVLFTGFLRGLDVERIYQIADLFVMPSVSEPFGIAPLEAVARHVPTIISKQSGVGEVLRHALKVDFWDTNELANKIVAVLRHPTLAAVLREEGSRDVAKLSWNAAAKACLRLYAHATNDLSITPTAGPTPSRP